ncbi:MAG: hypothetical protein EZS28_013477 [Streblomastix strix]|uniref:Uncharacterized protein n=1 Tax=Streblomastix strix TaxID=222440 RepID=A0A5J4W7Z6_9EUKA|nr:MAG: hypothetical protein EZS28_013477 [Streblomastix strix]
MEEIEKDEDKEDQGDATNSTVTPIAITYSLFIFNTNPKRGGMNSHCNGEYAAFSTAYIAFQILMLRFTTTDHGWRAILTLIPTALMIIVALIILPKYRLSANIVEIERMVIYFMIRAGCEFDAFLPRTVVPFGASVAHILFWLFWILATIALAVLTFFVVIERQKKMFLLIPGTGQMYVLPQKDKQNQVSQVQGVNIGVQSENNNLLSKKDTTQDDNEIEGPLDYESPEIREREEYNQIKPFDMLPQFKHVYEIEAGVRFIQMKGVRRREDLPDEVKGTIPDIANLSVKDKERVQLQKLRQENFHHLLVFCGIILCLSDITVQKADSLLRKAREQKALIVVRFMTYANFKQTADDQDQQRGREDKGNKGVSDDGDDNIMTQGSEISTLAAKQQLEVALKQHAEARGWAREFWNNLLKSYAALLTEIFREEDAAEKILIKADQIDEEINPNAGKGTKADESMGGSSQKSEDLESKSSNTRRKRRKKKNAMQMLDQVDGQEGTIGGGKVTIVFMKSVTEDINNMTTMNTVVMQIGQIAFYSKCYLLQEFRESFEDVDGTQTYINFALGGSDSKSRHYMPTQQEAMNNFTIFGNSIINTLKGVFAIKNFLPWEIEDVYQLTAVYQEKIIISLVQQRKSLYDTVRTYAYSALDLAKDNNETDVDQEIIDSKIYSKLSSPVLNFPTTIIESGKRAIRDYRRTMQLLLTLPKSAIHQITLSLLTAQQGDEDDQNAGNTITTMDNTQTMNWGLNEQGFGEGMEGGKQDQNNELEKA